MLIRIANDEVEKLFRDIFENFPEYASSYLLCEKFQYDGFQFEFIDIETEQHHIVDLAAAKKGFKIMLKELLAGKIKLSIGSNIFDAANWDSEAADALVQYAIFGKAIYG